MAKKHFKLTLNDKTIIDLGIEGDDNLVEDFVEIALTDSYGAFRKSQDIFGDIFINGIKHEIQVIRRDDKGHFIKSIPNLKGKR